MCLPPGGGQVVTIKDPDGISLNIVYGSSPVEPKAPPRGASPYNNAQMEHNSKQRKGTFQRVSPGPSPIFKLGHFGHMSNNMKGISEWYMTNFNLRAVDIQAAPWDKSTVRISTFIYWAEMCIVGICER